jgi:hypothetical protein
MVKLSEIVLGMSSHCCNENLTHTTMKVRSDFKAVFDGVLIVPKTRKGGGSMVAS